MLTFFAESTSAYPAKADLIAKMKGQDCTDGWDVACAYKLDRLNTVLVDLYQAANSKLVKTVTIGTSSQPYSQTYTVVNVPGVFQGLTLSITETYTFELSQPVLQFSAVNNLASLNMPIAGSSVTTSDCTLKLLDPQPSNVSQLLQSNTWYKLVDAAFVAATVDEINAARGDDKLALQFYIRAEDSSLDGQTSYQNKAYQLQHIQEEQPKSPLDGDPNTYVLEALVPLVSVVGDSTVHSGSSVVVFDNTTDLAKIVLHFDNTAGSGTTFALYKGGVKANPDILKTAPDILLRIANYFAQSVRDIDYVLTELKASSVSADGINLTPKSFRFATQASGTDGTLTVFIQTNESGLPAGGANLIFQDATNIPFLPVSADANTTIIYSRTFMSRAYLVQGLQKNGFQNVSNQGTDNTPISVSGDYQTSVTVSIDTMYNVGTYDDISVDTVSIGSMPVTLAFDSGNNLHISSSLSKNTTIHLHWVTVAPCFSTDHYGTETATINVGLTKTVPLAWTVNAATGSISFSFAVAQTDYTVNVDSSISDKCSSSVREHVNDQISKQVASVLPTITIPMTALNALAEENLLFNGQSLFKLDSTLGIFTPQDVVLFGNI